jgi:diphthamide biosynthesis methyltransferase
MSKQKRSFFEPVATVSPVFVLAGSMIAWVSHSLVALQEVPLLTVGDPLHATVHYVCLYL